jgi:hypothetical protein
MYLHLNIHNLSTHSHPSEEENRSRICKCKQAFATEWQCTIDLFVKRRVLPHKLMIVKKYNQWCSKGLIFFLGGGSKEANTNVGVRLGGLLGWGKIPRKILKSRVIEMLFQAFCEVRFCKLHQSHDFS